LSSQVKSKERVAEYGEVFTADREVKAMCDLVDDKCRDFEAKFLEPACGEGIFLLEILKRKLENLKIEDYERNSLIALSSLYGIDIIDDNVKKCRKNLLELWENNYKKICGEFPSEDVKKSAEFILEKNIVCGDSINGTGKIFFSEWTFFNDKINVQREDYSFYDMTEGNMFANVPVKIFDPIEYKKLWTMEGRTK